VWRPILALVVFVGLVVAVFAAWGIGLAHCTPLECGLPHDIARWFIRGFIVVGIIAGGFLLWWMWREPP
jgi:hypothetical protein